MKNAHLENFFRLSSELLCIIDHNGFFTMVNPAFSELLGYSPEELSQIHYTSLIHPEDLEQTDRQAQKLLNGITVNQFENRYIARDKRVIWLSWTSSTLLNSFLYAAAKDISQQKEAEQSLQTSEKKFRSLVHNGYEIISVIGPDGNYTYHSGSLYRVLGYRPEELVGVSALALIHPDDVEKVAKATRQLRSQDFVNNGIPYRVKAADGTYKWLESSGSNMIEDPSIKGIVVNSRDVTEKILLQQQLQLQAAQKEKEIAVSMIHGQEIERTRLGQELHDNINQLLTSVKLYVEFMQANADGREELLPKCHQQLDALIREVRQLSHRLVLPSLETLDLKKAMEELANDLLSPSKILFHLSVICFKEHPLNEGFKMVLYRIVQEQLTNIVKHAGASLVTISLRKENEQMELVVTDNGKGFDHPLKKRGMGLVNICNRARVFGGEMQIETAPGKGCQLRVVFQTKEIEKNKEPKEIPVSL
jgi:PAS domain S-box-containing protein